MLRRLTGTPTYHADRLVRRARVIQRIKDQDYGLRNFAAADLDGNMIIFDPEIAHG